MENYTDLFTIPKQKTRANYFYLIRALNFIWKTSHISTILMLINTTISALFPAASLFVMKFVIDNISNILRASDPSQSMDNIYILVVILIGLWVLQHFVTVFGASISSWLQIRVEQNAQLTIMRKCSEFDIAFFENPTYLNMLQNAHVGASGNLFYVIELFFNFIKTNISLISFIIILFRLHWGAVLILIIAMLPQILANRYIAKKRWEITTGLVEPQRMSSYFSAIVTSRSAAKEIRIFGLFKHFLKLFKTFINRFFQIESNFIRKRAIIGFFVNLTSIAGAAVVWIYIIRSAINSTISIGDIVLFTGAVSSFQGGLSSLFSLVGQFLKNVLFLQHLFSLLDLKPISINGTLTGPADVESQRSGDKVPPSVLKSGIRFKNVSFKYPGTDNLVLNNINISLNPGDSVAIVGANGAGKTTLIKLLARLYDPTEGQILIDDIDIKEYDLESLHKLFSVIFQDFTCYPLTVRDNIGFGNIKEINNKSSIFKAAKKAGADEFIERYPNKYETYIGRQFQKSSIDPSIGEWQKICLSRALMREEAPILILDEPTAALDVYAEYEIYKNFSKMMANKLAIIISHRFSTVRAAKHILVLHQGSVIEEGTHEELLSRDTLYKEMYSIQAERYK
jgi:ABC-type multidrug transport system fused ATPase/permease subunit